MSVTDPLTSAPLELRPLIKGYPPFTRALPREFATHDLVRDICGISGA
jgi:hypothetical protein